MRIIKADDYYSMSRMAANIISAQIIMKPKCVIGLATGSTPLGTYAQLIEWYKKGDLDFSEVTTATAFHAGRTGDCIRTDRNRQTDGCGLGTNGRTGRRITSYRIVHKMLTF